MRLCVNYPLFLYFNQTGIFTSDFRKIRKYQISWKSVKWKPSCCSQTDRHDEANSLFRNSANVAKNDPAIDKPLRHGNEFTLRRLCVIPVFCNITHKLISKFRPHLSCTLHCAVEGFTLPRNVGNCLPADTS
jgi:hypothetical protein